MGALPQDSTNLKGNYGDSDYDIRHTVTGYVIYDIPGLSHGPAWITPPNGYIGGGFGQSSDTIGDYSGAPGIGPGTV